MIIEVVAGVIYKDDKFLIAQRNLKKAQGGLWEFPGGKLEPNETAAEALKREIKEEFDADIEVGNYIGESIHHYPEKDIKVMYGFLNTFCIFLDEYCINLMKDLFNIDVDKELLYI